MAIEIQGMKFDSVEELQDTMLFFHRLNGEPVPQELLDEIEARVKDSRLEYSFHSKESLVSGDKVLFKIDYIDSDGDSASMGSVGVVDEVLDDKVIVDFPGTPYMVFVVTEDVEKVLEETHEEINFIDPEVEDESDRDRGLKVGDIAKVIEDCVFFSEGEQVELTKVDGDGVPTAKDDHGVEAYVGASKLKKIEVENDLPKIGDKVFLTEDAEFDMTYGKAYEVVGYATEPDGDYFAIIDDEGDRHLWNVSFIESIISSDEEETFEVGDRVRVIESELNGYPVGTIATVVRVTNFGIIILEDGDLADKAHPERELEKFTGLTAGDKVMMLEDLVDFSEGSIYEIIGIPDYGDYEAVDDVGDVWWMRRSHLGEKFRLATEDEIASAIKAETEDIEKVESLGRDADGESLIEGDYVTGTIDNDYGITNYHSICEVKSNSAVKVIQSNDDYGRQYEGETFGGIDLGNFIKLSDNLDEAKAKFNELNPEPKFKVGDTVVIVVNSTGGLTVGDTGVVTGVIEHEGDSIIYGDSIVYKVKGDRYPGSMEHPETDLKRHNGFKFKIGDTVKVSTDYLGDRGLQEVSKVDVTDSYLTYYVVPSCYWVPESSMEKASEAEIEESLTQAESDPQVGDIVTTTEELNSLSGTEIPSGTSLEIDYSTDVMVAGSSGNVVAVIYHEHAGIDNRDKVKVAVRKADRLDI